MQLDSSSWYVLHLQCKRKTAASMPLEDGKRVKEQLRRCLLCNQVFQPSGAPAAIKDALPKTPDVKKAGEAFKLPEFGIDAGTIALPGELMSHLELEKGAKGSQNGPCSVTCRSSPFMSSAHSALARILQHIVRPQNELLPPSYLSSLSQQYMAQFIPHDFAILDSASH